MDNILIVAPFKHLAQLAQRVLAEIHIDIPIVVGNDLGGFDTLALNYPDAKIFISRGGSAKALRQKFPDRVVIDIYASFYDVAIGIEALIRRGCRNIGVVTHDNIIGMTSADISFGIEKVTVIPCSNADEIVLAVDRCVKDGADGIVGCVAAVGAAHKHHVPCEYIDSDFFSMRRAIFDAIAVEKTLHNQELMIEQLNSLIDNIEEGIVIFDNKQLPIFFNDEAVKIFENIPKEQWCTKIAKYLDKTHPHPHVITINNRQIIIHTFELRQNADESHYLAIMQEGALIEQSEKAIRLASYAQGLYAKLHFSDLLFVDPIMIDVVELAKKFAKSDSTVLITGATGVGKEGFAQSIHNASYRGNKPFVSVNCASLPQGLIGSELFGYVDGAFTGARQNGKKGLFEMAQGGTIFLDEITEIPLEFQGQFLRVLQEREVMRIGDDKVIPLDIRVICATNKKILPLCEAGKFRYDLYYRINVLKLRIPPLKDRIGDIVPLFIRFVAAELNCYEEEVVIDKEGRQLLTDYPWPGNVRELKNIAEACSFNGPHIRTSYLRDCFDNNESENESNEDYETLRIPKDASLDTVSSIYIKKLLSIHNIKEVCQISGLSRSSLWRKQNKLFTDKNS